MPEEIVTRILRLPGYGVYGWEMDEATNTLTLSIRQTADEPYYVCGGCGISRGERGRCGCGWRCIACTVAAVACGLNGCPSWTGRCTTQPGSKRSWLRTARPRR